jgi:hypothetical protein
MIIGAPSITRTGQTVRYAVEVRESRRPMPAELWFEIPAEFADHVTDKADAAVLGLLIPAMETGEPLHAEGRVSRRLLTALNDAYQPMLLPVLPHLRLIPVTAAEVTTETYPTAHAVATGYSGGVDSLTTLLRPRPDGEQPISLLVHNEVGAHGDGAKAAGIFRERLARAHVAAARFGLPLIGIDSNLAAFYPQTIPFIATHSPRNAAALLVLQRGVSVYEYSSGHPRHRQVLRKPGDIARIDEVSLPLLSTESFRLKPTGADYTRLQKLLLVSAEPVTYGLLDVCLKPRRARGRINCSTCVKCLRAQFLLESVGRLQHYHQVFDLRRFARLRTFQITDMLRGQLDQPDELLHHALDQGVKVPWLARFYALPGIYPVARLFHRLVARLP